MIKLKKYEVIETKEMLRGEFIENHYAIYEETENKQFELKNNYCVEVECIVQKNITIFKGDSQSTLQKIKAYPIENANVRAIREMILKDFPALFKNVQFRNKAV